MSIGMPSSCLSRAVRLARHAEEAAPVCALVEIGGISGISIGTSRHGDLPRSAPRWRQLPSVAWRGWRCGNGMAHAAERARVWYYAGVQALPSRARTLDR